jgi:hypothetical protein
MGAGCNKNLASLQGPKQFNALLVLTEDVGRAILFCLRVDAAPGATLVSRAGGRQRLQVGRTNGPNEILYNRVSVAC